MAKCCKLISTKNFLIIFCSIILILSALALNNTNEHIKKMGDSDVLLDNNKNALIGILVLNTVVLLLTFFNVLFKSN